jgi:membrane-associated protein
MTEFFQQFFSSDGLRQLITNGGVPVLFAIIFAETGLLLGFFLPGDTLLVMTGLLCNAGVITMDIVTLNIILITAAITGDALGYYIGKKAGSKLYERPDSKLFKREHLLKTKSFYDKHGGKTIILARFIPIIRTFAPTVAGTVGMQYRRFALFNIVGGILWISSTTLLGYFLGATIPGIEKYLHLAIFAVVGVSLLLPIVQYIRHKREKRSTK